jgi:hypothetical protein
MMGNRYLVILIVMRPMLSVPASLKSYWLRSQVTRSAAQCRSYELVNHVTV